MSTRGIAREAIGLVMADDDRDDQLLTREALVEAQVENPIDFVNDGEELLEYLRRTGRYAGFADLPLPGLVLLDLNMPRMDGREALRELKADARLRCIPVLIVTTSRADHDVVRCYELGAASFLTKPPSYAGLVELMRTVGRYWIGTVELP